MLYLLINKIINAKNKDFYKEVLKSKKLGFSLYASYNNAIWQSNDNYTM